MAENFTDLSQLLINAMNGEIKNNPKLINEIEKQKISNQSQAAYLLNLCNIITKRIYTETRTSARGNQYLYYRKDHKRGRDYTYAELMTYGAQLVYAVRQFVNKEHLYFLFGTTYQEGGQKLTQQKVDVDVDVMQNFVAFPKGRFIGLTTEFQQAVGNLQYSEILTKRVSEWQRVSELGEFKKPNDGRHEKFEIKEHKVYRSIKNDKRILATYSTENNKERKIALYYDKGVGDYQFFNHGWLFEWYNAALNNWSDTEYQNLQNKIQAGSIQPLFQKFSLDNVAGTKAGDFLSATGKQVQSKLDNQKIITYNNILRIITELKIGLEQFVNSKGASSEALISTLQKHFIPDAAQSANQWGNKQIKRLLEDFKKENKFIQ